MLTLTRRAFSAGSGLALAAPGIARATPAQPFFTSNWANFAATPTGLLTGRPVWKSAVGARLINNFLNDEQEYYQSSLSPFSPFSVSHGRLALTAAPAPPGSNPAGKPYISGLINSITLPGGTFTSARIDIRALLPKGHGLWPAIWLLPTDDQWPPEIDIMEMLGQDPTKIYCSLHWGHGDDAERHKHTQPIEVADTSSGFHQYGLDFDSTRPGSPITFFFDNHPVYQTSLPPRLLGFTWYLIINMTVGNTDSWGGAPNAATRLPASMLIDSIKLYPSGTPLPAS
jgi:beta-glucanase (GH16 family)